MWGGPGARWALSPFVVDVPDCLQAGFRYRKGQQTIREERRMGYALFNYDAAADKFSADAKSLSDCGHACHTVVKAKDYMFHPYQKR